MKNKKIYIFCILIILFIINTIFVINNGYTSIDSSLHNFIDNFNSDTLTKIMHIITFFGGAIFMALLCFLLVILFITKKLNNKFYCIMGTLMISTMVNCIIKLIIRRPRPEYMTVVENTFSYPSGHMMASTTLYGFLIYLILKSNKARTNKALYALLLGMLIILIGISRMYLGAHYFSDVFGGLLLSISIILLFDILNDKTKILSDGNN